MRKVIQHALAALALILILTAPYFIRDCWLEISDYYPPGHLVRGLNQVIEDEHRIQIVDNSSFLMVKDLHEPPAIPQMWLPPDTNPEIRNHVGDILIIEKGSVLSPDQIENQPKVFLKDPNDSNDFTAVVVQIDEFRVVEDN